MCPSVLTREPATSSHSLLVPLLPPNIYDCWFLSLLLTANDCWFLFLLPTANDCWFLSLLLTANDCWFLFLLPTANDCWFLSLLLTANDCWFLFLLPNRSTAREVGSLRRWRCSLGQGSQFNLSQGVQSCDIHVMYILYVCSL